MGGFDYDYQWNRITIVLFSEAPHFFKISMRNEGAPLIAAAAAAAKQMDNDSDIKPIY